ncbi:unnamed protein product [Ranitomeya imitator]|uniref:Helix-turn-helix domain-containing protein n=1 Tax=Ranitomeya imitator TaxID=111125 RepID=A0ABN9LA73_9NEOB|nr:unnamed protein product [Ranitomeya imitator]
MDTAQYVGEIRSQLSDGDVYERLQVNPTQVYKLELDNMIDEALHDGLIDTKLAKYLKVDHPVVPVLYTLPKIHKDLQRPPGRPIVLGRGSLCNKVAIFLDRLLRKFATSAPSYVRDTSDFIRSLEGVQSKMQFLDTCVYKSDGLLHTDLFVKHTDRNNLLHFSSEHPRRMVESLPWSQLLRVRRIVSNDTLVDKRLDEMCLKFLARGYPGTDLAGFKARALSKERVELLGPRVRALTDKRIPFITAYNSLSNQISGVIRRHWPLLSLGHANIQEFQLPPLLSYRRNRNLKDELVVSDIGSSKRELQTTFGRPSLGNFPCLNCACCNNMVKGASFYHPHTGRKYEIRKRYTCKTSFAVYVLSCPCGLYYVGATTMEVRARISKHKSTIRTRRVELPVPRHFHDMGHSVNQLRYRIIDDVPVLRRGGDRVSFLKKKELKWIFELDTLSPRGMNIEYQQSIFL